MCWELLSSPYPVLLAPFTHTDVRGQVPSTYEPSLNPRRGEEWTFGVARSGCLIDL
ncbi:hypothetical protein ABBQ32_007312 [Trebouxia sp. C0010 RCD-2024]